MLLIIKDMEVAVARAVQKPRIETKNAMELLNTGIHGCNTNRP